MSRTFWECERWRTRLPTSNFRIDATGSRRPRSAIVAPDGRAVEFRSTDEEIKAQQLHGQHAIAASSPEARSPPDSPDVEQGLLTRVQILQFLDPLQAGRERCARQPPPPAARVRSPYEGATTGRRLGTWATTRDAVNSVWYQSADQLVARSRDIARKDGWAAKAIDEWVCNAIGNGIKPQSLHPDQADQGEDPEALVAVRQRVRRLRHDRHLRPPGARVPVDGRGRRVLRPEAHPADGRRPDGPAPTPVDRGGAVAVLPRAPDSGHAAGQRRPRVDRVRSGRTPHGLLLLQGASRRAVVLPERPRPAADSGRRGHAPVPAAASRPTPRHPVAGERPGAAVGTGPVRRRRTAAEEVRRDDDGVHHPAEPGRPVLRQRADDARRPPMPEARRRMPRPGRPGGATRSRDDDGPRARRGREVHRSRRRGRQLRGVRTPDVAADRRGLGPAVRHAHRRPVADEL